MDAIDGFLKSVLKVTLALLGVVFLGGLLTVSVRILMLGVAGLIALAPFALVLYGFYLLLKPEGKGCCKGKADPKAAAEFRKGTHPEETKPLIQYSDDPAVRGLVSTYEEYVGMNGSRAVPAEWGPKFSALADLLKLHADITARPDRYSDPAQTVDAITGRVSEMTEALADLIRRNNDEKVHNAQAVINALDVKSTADAFTEDAGQTAPAAAPATDQPVTAAAPTDATAPATAE